MTTFLRKRSVTSGLEVQTKETRVLGSGQTEVLGISQNGTKVNRAMGAMKMTKIAFNIFGMPNNGVINPVKRRVIFCAVRRFAQVENC